MTQQTPASSLPAIPEIKSEPVPQWCVRRYPCIGGHSVMLRGFDGEGYPIYEWAFPLDEDLERWERLMQNCLNTRRARNQGSLTKTTERAAPAFLSPCLPPALRVLR